MITRLLARFAFVGVAVLAVAWPAAAFADVGAGVGASPIVLAPTATPGREYSLPPLYVMNTGTVTSSYKLRVEQFSPHSGRSVPERWISFARNDFVLAPKAYSYVKLTLSVPSGAPAGSYTSDLVAGTVAGHVGAGTVAAAQAATKLMFSVRDGGGGLPWLWPLWAYLVIGTLLLVGLMVVIQRRYGFHLQVERRH